MFAPIVPAVVAALLAIPFPYTSTWQYSDPFVSVFAKPKGVPWVATEGVGAASQIVLQPTNYFYGSLCGVPVSGTWAKSGKKKARLKLDKASIEALCASLEAQVPAMYELFGAVDPTAEFKIARARLTLEYTPGQQTIAKLNLRVVGKIHGLTTTGKALKCSSKLLFWDVSEGPLGGF